MVSIFMLHGCGQPPQGAASDDPQVASIALPQIMFIIGPNGSGKSTIAKSLHGNLGEKGISNEWIDSDKLVDENDKENKWVKSVNRALEKAESLVKGGKKDLVIIAGFITPKLRVLIKDPSIRTWVIRVEVEKGKHIERLAERCRKESPDSPEKALKQLESQKNQIYSDEAEDHSLKIDYIIDNTADNVEKTVENFIQQLIDQIEL